MNLALLSYVLLALSTVAASLFAARIPIMAGPFVASVVVMVASVVMMRVAVRARIAREVQDNDDGAFDFLASVRLVLRMLAELDESGEADCEVIHRRLDGLVDGPLFDFEEARSGLLALHGFAPYARVVSEFTRGERAVNRSWSAAVDGYPDEARASLGRAREIFTDLVGELERLARQSSR
jgi:hypothetical protein